MTMPNQFPFVAQSEYARISYGQFPGDVWEGDLYNERISRGLIAHVTPVSQVTEILIGANNPGDSVGVYIDGALFVATAGASAGATALALEAVLEGSAILASVVASVTVNSATLTVTFADDQPHAVTEYSPAATTATVTPDTAAVSQQRIRFGYGVVKQATGASINTIKIAKPTSLDDVYAGVIFRTPSSGMPNMMVSALDPDYDVNYLPPGFAYSIAWRDMGIVVEFVGTAPTELDDVYLIMTGADAGKWRADDGSTPDTAGTSQVSTLTLASVADGDIGFSYDGLPALSVTATANNTNDAASLYALFVGNASYMALVSNDLANIVDNLDGTLTITFGDDQVHTFADESTGTSTVAENIDTAAVAIVPGIPATAKLIPGASWGKPSNTGGEVPCAYLRLNNP